ncbi:MAG: hypothetical protein H7Z43_02540 [Clostridia bacterium]|nr:hypothetical protein [Deltaproteobacteria bacterium]
MGKTLPTQFPPKRTHLFLVLSCAAEQKYPLEKSQVSVVADESQVAVPAVASSIFPIDVTQVSSAVQLLPGWPPT